jgi:hypothetical protein
MEGSQLNNKEPVMFSLTYKMIGAIILGFVFFAFTGDAGGQKPPREVRDLRERERTEQSSSTRDKDSKWSRDLQKDSLKDAERKLIDRNPPSRGGKPVEKAEKWSRGDLKKKFNDAANPPKKDDGKTDGDKNPIQPPRPPLPRFKPPGI